MANSYYGNPWILDTAGVISTTPVIVTKMEWQPNAASDSLEVRDNASKAVVWKRTSISAAPAGIEVWDAPADGFYMNGFDLESVGSSCTLYVWLR